MEYIEQAREAIENLKNEAREHQYSAETVDWSEQIRKAHEIQKILNQAYYWEAHSIGDNWDTCDDVLDALQEYEARQTKWVLTLDIHDLEEALYMANGCVDALEERL